MFRPFKLKKWFMLLVIGALAFQLQGGCNSNINLPGPQKAQQAKEDSTQEESTLNSETTSNKAPDKPSPAVQLKALRNSVTEKVGQVGVIAIVALILLGILFLFLLINWVYSRFYFVYINAIVSNDASIKVPFKSSKGLGTSYFLWNIITSGVFLLLFGLMIKLGHSALVGLGVFVPDSGVGAGRVFLAVLPFAMIAFGLMLFGGFLGFFVTDYVVVIMFKKKLSVLKALPLGFTLLKDGVGNFFIYGFIKLGLSIIGSIVAGIIGFLTTITLMVPVLLIGAAGFGIFKILPVFMQPILIILGVVIGGVLLVALSVLMNLILLPLSVFLKTFNIKFIGRLNQEYNLFRS